VTEPLPPAAPASRTGPERRAALPRELADFLIEFSIALHKHAMYPGGHPTLDPAAEAVARRLESLLLDRGTLSLGVARNQLVIEGVATDPKNPVLHDLATRLHRHHLGAVSFSRGVTWEELQQALKVLALESDREAEPIGLRPRDQVPRWPHVQLFPLTFERLQLVGGPEEGEGAAVSGGRAAQLWVGLARAALAAEDRPPEPAREPPPPEPFAFRPTPQPTAPLTEDEIEAALGEVQAGELQHDSAEPTDVARAIESHERGTAYDQVIVGYLLQIAEELKTTGGAGAAALKRKMSRLITALDQSTLTRLVEMGGDATQRRQFLLDASQGMAVDAVVELVRAATGTGAPVSSAMLRMLQKLGRHAERGPAPRRAIAETELREQVRELVAGWSLADPNPDGYALALRRMSEAAPTLVAATEQVYAPEPVRLVQMAIEAGGRGGVLDRAVDALVAGGRVSELLDLLERAPADNAAALAVRERVVDPAMLKLALTGAPVDFALVDRLVSALGERAVEPMLDVLAESESRQVRRGLIDRLQRLGEAVKPALAARLGDERWFVLRNVLYLAAELPGPVALDVSALRQHPDPRVRREALRVMLRQEGDGRTRALAAALSDADPRVKRLALAAAAERGCPDAAVPLVVAVASDDELDEDLRVAAVRVLGGQGGRLALEALLKLTEVKRRSLLGAMMTAAGATSPVVVAAIGALGPFRHDPRARDRLETYAHSKDAAVHKAATNALRGT
jgi:hypothetical protein